jgi:ABC-type transporter MlaC component
MKRIEYNIQSYGSHVLYTRESDDENDARVDTEIVGDKQQPLAINYRLHSVDKDWKIYDLVIEDM